MLQTKGWETFFTKYHSWFNYFEHLIEHFLIIYYTIGTVDLLRLVAQISFQVQTYQLYLHGL